MNSEMEQRDPEWTITEKYLKKSHNLKIEMK